MPAAEERRQFASTPHQSPLDWPRLEVGTFPRVPGEAPICMYLLAGSIHAISFTSSLQVEQPLPSGAHLSLAD